MCVCVCQNFGNTSCVTSVRCQEFFSRSVFCSLVLPNSSKDHQERTPTTMMRNLLVTLLLCACSTTSATTFPDEQAWKQVVLGFLEGAFGPTQQKLETCVLDGVLVLDDLQKAVEDIRQDTPESVQEGIELIGDAIQVAADDLKECAEAMDNLEELMDMAQLLAHPWSFIYHAGHNLIVNHVEIFDEVQAAMDAWESDPKQYYRFGFNVGEALEQISVAQQEGFNIVGAKVKV